MKLALRGALVLVVAGMAAQVGAAAPSRMHLVTSPDSFLLWNKHDGLLGVGRCDVATDVHAGECVSGAVERTTDGGRTYHVVLRTHEPVGSLQTIGRNGAIATSYDDRSWRTTDGGRTWRRVPTQPVVYWRTSRMGVSFRNYFVGNRLHLALRVTHDGGRTWHRQFDPCERSFAFSAAADVATPELWWVVCRSQPAAGQQQKEIYRTRDGGRTWQAVGGVSISGYAGTPSFAPVGFGLLGEDLGGLYVTRDGGMHWREVRAAHPEVFDGGGRAFGDGTAYVLLTNTAFGSHIPATQLIETRDFGRTWRVVRRWP